MKALMLGTFVIAAIAVSAMLDSDTGLSIWLELRRDGDWTRLHIELPFHVRATRH